MNGTPPRQQDQHTMMRPVSFWDEDLCLFMMHC
jgi:hypothetical protein